MRITKAYLRDVKKRIEAKVNEIFKCDDERLKALFFATLPGCGLTEPFNREQCIKQLMQWAIEDALPTSLLW